jgi:hypothetical protein
MNGGAFGKVLALLMSFQLVPGIPPVVLPPGALSPSPPEGGGTLWAASGLAAPESAGGPVDIGTPVVLHFAQVGNGQGLVSDLVLTNPSSASPVTGRVEFFGDDGDPLELSLASPSGRFFAVDFTVPPLGATRVVTDGGGALVAGAARVTADRRLGGVVRFTIPGVGTTGVGESQASRAFLTPARRSAINTGLALHNPGKDPVRLRLTLRSAAGVPPPGGRALLDLPALGHTARFIDELFGGLHLSGFEGTLGVEVMGPGEVAATALELGGAAGQFTTLPVIAEPQAGPVPYFAQMGNGGGLVSELILANPSRERDIAARVQFLGGDGGSLEFGLTSPPGRRSSLDVTVKALGMTRIATDSLGDVAAGAVRVAADGRLGGVVRFTIPGVGTTGVGESRPVGSFVIPARRTAVNTGLALHNAGAEGVEVRLRLRRSDGTPVAGAQKTIELAGGGHRAQFVGELFPGVVPQGFEGTLTAEVQGGSGKLAATALELGNQPGQFTTLPVTALGGALTVSVAAASPGQFVDLRHDSIAAGSRPVVEVEGVYPDSTVLIESAFASAGTARFVVPPVFHSTSGAPVGGTVTLRLLGSGETASLRIDAPEALPDVEAGALLSAFLTRTAENLGKARDDLADLGALYGIDTASPRARLDERIAVIEAAVAEIQTRGQLTMVGEDGMPLVLDGAALRRNDQLLMAVVNGFRDELGVASTGSISPQQGTNPNPGQEFLAGWADALDRAMDNIELGAGAVVGAVSLVVALTAGAKAGIVILAIAGGGYVLIEGVHSEGLAALADRLRGPDAQGYEFGQQLVRSAGQALESLAISVGGIKSSLLNLYGTINDAVSVYDVFGIKSCQDEHSSQSVGILPASASTRFCDDVLPLLPPVAVILGGPLSLSPETSGAWRILPIGGSAPYAAEIFWGDGSGAQLSLPTSGGQPSHSYAAAGTYPIRVSLRDRTGGYGAAESVVLVSGAESLAGTIDIPGFVTRTFDPPVVFFGLTRIIEGESTVLLDRIPVVGGGTTQMPWEAGGEVLSILVHPNQAGRAPFTTRNIGWLPDGGDVHVVYSSHAIRNETDQWPVGLVGVSGTVSLSQLGNRVGDRVSGTFNVRIEGERAVCAGSGCTQVSYQTVAGTVAGAFEGTVTGSGPTQADPGSGPHVPKE